MPFLGITDVKMKWENNSSDISAIVSQQSSSYNQLIWTDIYSSDYYIDDCFQIIFSLAATESKTIDFTNIEYDKLDKTLIKSWSSLKILSIRNTSEEDYIDIGRSGLSNPLLIVSSNMDVGPLGIFVYQDRLGYEITPSAKNLRIENNSDNTIEIDLCCGGVIDV